MAAAAGVVVLASAALSGVVVGTGGVDTAGVVTAGVTTAGARGAEEELGGSSSPSSQYSSESSLLGSAAREAVEAAAEVDWVTDGLHCAGRAVARLSVA